MRYATWTFEIESCERGEVTETHCGEHSDLPIDRKSWRRAQISNQFATVTPHETIIPHAKVGTVYNKQETIVPLTIMIMLDELN
jgi:hypothetical protein